MAIPFSNGDGSWHRFDANQDQLHNIPLYLNCPGVNKTKKNGEEMQKQRVQKHKDLRRIVVWDTPRWAGSETSEERDDDEDGATSEECLL
jgi:hypothetical protein